MVTTTGSATTPYATTSKLSFDSTSGQITAVDFNSTSDINLKTDIKDLNNSINILKKISPVSFKWKDDKRISYGVIAQEIENILPELVKETDGIKSVSYIPIIAFLIDAVVELSNKFDKINNITE
jgi:hypothetical protein